MNDPLTLAKLLRFELTTLVRMQEAYSEFPRSPDLGVDALDQKRQQPRRLGLFPHRKDPGKVSEFIHHNEVVLGLADAHRHNRTSHIRV